jgi:hypothetical protein
VLERHLADVFDLAFRDVRGTELDVPSPMAV